MIVTLQTERVRTLEQVRAFVEGSEAVDFAGADRESVYEFVRRALVRLGYERLGKSDKGLVRRYLAKVTGLSRAQLTRLIGQHRETGRIEDRRGGAPACPFERRYTRADIRQLAALDNAERFLKPGVTFDQLDAIAHAVSDLEAANALNDARHALFRTIGRTWRARPDPPSHPHNPPPQPRTCKPTVRPNPGGRPPSCGSILTAPTTRLSHRPPSAFGQRTDQGLCRPFVPFNIPLPFTHFPTPPTTPSTSPPSGSSSYWKRLGSA